MRLPKQGSLHQSALNTQSRNPFDGQGQRRIDSVFKS